MCAHVPPHFYDSAKESLNYAAGKLLSCEEKNYCNEFVYSLRKASTRLETARSAESQAKMPRKPDVVYGPEESVSDIYKKMFPE
jgi:hypothetical protein